MARRTTFDEAPEFDVGDRVVLTAGVGSMIRPRIRRGARGIVTARLDDDRLTVRFDAGEIETMRAAGLRLDLHEGG